MKIIFLIILFHYSVSLFASGTSPVSSVATPVYQVIEKTAPFGANVVIYTSNLLTAQSKNNQALTSQIEEGIDGAYCIQKVVINYLNVRGADRVIASDGNGGPGIAEVYASSFKVNYYSDVECTVGASYQSKQEYLKLICPLNLYKIAMAKCTGVAPKPEETGGACDGKDSDCATETTLLSVDKKLDSIDTTLRDSKDELTESKKILDSIDATLDESNNPDMTKSDVLQGDLTTALDKSLDTYDGLIDSGVADHLVFDGGDTSSLKSKVLKWLPSKTACVDLVVDLNDAVTSSDFTITCSGTAPIRLFFSYILYVMTALSLFDVVIVTTRSI